MQKGVTKVQVINFPPKNKWDKLQYITTILSLFIAVISTCLYLHEIAKEPDIYIEATPHVTSASGQAIIQFNDDGYSKETLCDIFVNNKGNKRSESITTCTIAFSGKIKVHLHSGTWSQNNEALPFSIWLYANKQFSINKNVSPQCIGTFSLSIPTQSEDILAAICIIEGDFQKKVGLIYYSYKEHKYFVKHYSDVNEAFQLWNDYFKIPVAGQN
jgi:hypothetical protein